MADVNPLKLVDLGDGQGQLREMQAGDKIPGDLLPATEWSADTVSQAEAEAGTETIRRAWTAERVRQAIVAWWNGATSAFGRGFVAAADAAAGRTALGLGTAAVANVTASQTDTTAGRVLRVGDGGLQGFPPIYSDSLSINACRFVRLPNSAQNIPVIENANAINMASSDLTNTTLLITWSNVAPRAFFRSQSTSYSPWREFYHTGNLTPNVLATYTLATLPSAAANPRLQVYCSNLAGQAAPVFSDGTNWRRVSDNTVAN